MAAEQGKDMRTGPVPALNIGLGGHEWVDAAVSGAIGLVAVPPVLLGTAYGIWKETQLDKEVWQVIDERVSAPAQAGP